MVNRDTEDFVHEGLPTDTWVVPQVTTTLPVLRSHLPPQPFHLSYVQLSLCPNISGISAEFPFVNPYLFLEWRDVKSQSSSPIVP